MLHFLSHSQIDKSAWDLCIYESKEGILYAYSWYLDIVSPNWEAFVWLDTATNGENYIAVMPLPIKKKYGIAYIELPLFTQQLGVFSTQKLSKEIFKSFLQAFQKHFKLVAGYPFNTINYKEFGKELFQDTKLPYQVHYTQHLDLNQSYTQIHKHYRRDTRYRLRKIPPKKFSLTKGQNVADLWDLFQKYTIPKMNIAVSPLAASLLEKIYTALEQRQLSELFFIHTDSIRSGVLIAKSQTAHTTTWIYLFNAATNTPKDESRRWFLDFFIKNKSENQSKKNKKNFFDFESAQEKQVADFYASFGSEKKEFIILKYNRLPYWVQFIQGKIWKIKQLLKYIKM